MLSKSRIILVLLISLLVAATAATMYPSLVWQPLEAQFEDLLDAEIACETTKWTTAFVLAAENCHLAGDAGEFEKVVISLPSRALTIGSWWLRDLPKGDEQARRDRVKFPNIPWPLEHIALLDGDLSRLGTAVDSLDTFTLNRRGLFSNSWRVHLVAAGGKFSADGLAGDEMNLHLKLSSWQPWSQLGKLDASMVLATEHLGREPLRVSLRELTLSSPTIRASGDVLVAPQLDGLLAFQDVRATGSGDLSLVTGGDGRRLLLKRWELSGLEAQLPISISGSVAGEIIINDSGLPETDLGFQNLALVLADGDRLGPLKAHAHAVGKELTEANAHLVSFPVSKLDPSLLQTGSLTADVSYSPTRGWQGDIAVEDVLAERFGNEMRMPSGSGTIHSDGSLDFSGQLLGATLGTLRVSGGLGSRQLRLIGDELRLDGFKLPALALEISGVLAQAEGEFDFQGNLTQAQLDMNEGMVSWGGDRLVLDRASFLSQGISRLEIRDLRLHSLTGRDSLKARGQIRDGVIEELRLDLDATTAAALRHTKPEVEFLQYFSQPEGALKASLLIEDSKLSSVDASLRNFGIRYRERAVHEGNGKLHLRDGNDLNLEHLALQLQDRSRLTLDGTFHDLGKLDELTPREMLLSFRGQAQGDIYPPDALPESWQRRWELKFDEAFVLPLSVELTPRQGRLGFDFDSEFESLGGFRTKWFRASGQDFPGYAAAQGSVDPATGQFTIEDIELALDGLNLAARAEGRPGDFRLKAFTDPVIDFRRLLADLAGVRIEGSMRGSLDVSGVDINQPSTYDDNLEFHLSTEPNQSLRIGALNMRDMDARFVSVAGKGDGSLLVNEGLLRNLPFRDFDATLSLTPDEQMSVSKVYMSTAKGGLDLTGDVSLLTSRGEFDAQGKSLDVGYIARGLAGERGFSGTGDFQAHFTGHLHSLLAANRPVSSSGQFELREGQVRPVENLESKLNLANLIFGGPFALNVNNLMELLAPSNRGSYDSLAGSWQLTDEIVQLPEIRYRGSNGLKLNLSGLWHRARGDVNFRIIGSYPKVPVRVNDEGEVIPVWEVIAGLHPASLLKRVGIFEPEPHAFAFDMRGNIANPVRLEGTAASTFRFLEGDYSRRELPHPEQPSLVQ